MTNLSQLADDAAGNVKSLQHSHTVRASLTAWLIQTVQAEATIRYRIAEIEDEAQRLRVQLDQIIPAIESLKQAIHSVDETIRRQRNETSPAAVTRAKAGQRKAETPPRQAAREPRAAARSGRRKESPRTGPGTE